ncbi:C-type lectin domain family 4 member E-like [Pecten maximus]|uniref:C-type lectin domain family 4 member E-like n=1 Tax=Pecten maximus TaxID=6579 RepID=UPI001458DCA3|nr:C-type lectin domain family 4 member E-like [Pecten maximus]
MHIPNSLTTKMAPSFALFVVLICSGVELVLTSCPRGWVEYQDECLLFVTNTTMGWHEAENVCRNYPSYLVTDDNEDKHDFIEMFINVFSHNWHLRHFWNGVSDFVVENQWRWVETGVSVESTTFWDKGQPNGLDGQNCVALTMNSANSLVWRDYDCTHKYHFICEMKATKDTIGVIG